jgi:hypothetical protein
MKLYELKINEDELEEGSEQGIYAISLVENPAIEEDFIYLSKEGAEEKVLLQEANDEQQTLIGAVLVPNKKIIRRDPQTGEEYYIYFEADTIKRAQELYFKNKNNDKFTVDHKRPVNDIYVFESWIVDDPNFDKSRAYGLDLPIGSWVVMAKVDNKKIWEEVKSGAYKGFSIEGLLKHNLKLAKLVDFEEDEPEIIPVPPPSGSILIDLINQTLLAQMNEIEEEEAEYMLQSIRGIIKKDKRLKKGARVELESYTDYPEAAKKAAASAIKKNEERTASQKCGTAVGKIRAQQIAQGKPLSYETIKRVYAYLSRAITFIDKSDPDYLNSCAYISVGLWGGEVMLPYARKILRSKGDLKLSKQDVFSDIIKFAKQTDITLIACSATKLEKPALAKELYQGSLFKKSLEYALKTTNSKDVYIVSAKYGLVGLNDVIEPYNVTLKDMSAEDRDDWGVNVYSELKKKYPQLDNLNVTILAGMAYYEPLIKLIKKYDLPLDGLRIGESMQELNEKLNIELSKLDEDTRMEFVLDCMLSELAAKSPYKEELAEVGPRGGIKASPKAPKSDTPNPNPKGEGTAKGDASGKRGAEVSAKDEETLKNKASEFNDKESNTKYGKANVGALKSVFQRGLGAYNTSRSPKVQSPSQWAFARVNAFLYLLKNGRPQNDGYTTDYDLLPKGHPKVE